MCGIFYKFVEYKRYTLSFSSTSWVVEVGEIFKLVFGDLGNGSGDESISVGNDISVTKNSDSLEVKGNTEDVEGVHHLSDCLEDWNSLSGDGYLGGNSEVKESLNLEVVEAVVVSFGLCGLVEGDELVEQTVFGASKEGVENTVISIGDGILGGYEITALVNGDLFNQTSAKSQELFKVLVSSNEAMSVKSGDAIDIEDVSLLVLAKGPCASDLSGAAAESDLSRDWGNE